MSKPLHALRFPIGTPDALKTEVKEFLACEQSIVMLKRCIERGGRLTDIERYQKRLAQAEETVAFFKFKYGLTNETV